MALSMSLPVEEEGPTDGDVPLDGEGHCRKTGAGESDLWENNAHEQISQKGRNVTILDGNLLLTSIWDVPSPRLSSDR